MKQTVLASLVALHLLFLVLITCPFISMAQQSSADASKGMRVVKPTSPSGEPIDNRYALIIGIDYKHSFSGLRTLPLSVNDARDMCAFMEGPGFWALPRGHIQFVANTGAYGSKQQIVQALDSLLAKVTNPAEATFYLYYSGHGDIIGLAPNDYNPNDANSIVSYAYIKRRLDEKGIGAKIFFLDTCFAGAVATAKSANGKSFDEAFRKTLQAGNSNRYTYFCAVSDIYEASGNGRRNSLYTDYLLKTLQCQDAGIDTDNNCLITAGEVGNYLNKVLRVSQPPFYQANGNDGFAISTYAGASCLKGVILPLLIVPVTSVLPASPANQKYEMTFSRNYVVPKDIPTKVVLGDLDSDGDQDFVALYHSEDGRPMAVCLNNGTGSFGQGFDFGIGGRNYPRDIVLTDADSDGDLDIVAANFKYDANTRQGYGSVSVSLNDGRANFRNNFVTEFDYAPNTLLTGDVNGDGNMDIITTSRNAITVLLGNRNHEFSITQTIACNEFTASSIALGDFDSDGDLDMLVPNADKPYTVNVMLNDGGHFKNGAQVAVDTYAPHYVSVGDVDGDGDLDFVTGRGIVRLNDGKGNFAAEDVREYGWFDDVKAVSLTDVDEDGDLDMVSTWYNGTKSYVRISINAGVKRPSRTRRFSTPIDIDVEVDARRVEVGDLNGDREPDLLVTGDNNLVARLHTRKQR